MCAHTHCRGSIIAAQLDPASADAKMKGYFDTANEKLNMPGIPGGEYPGKPLPIYKKAPAAKSAFGSDTAN